MIFDDGFCNTQKEESQKQAITRKKISRMYHNNLLTLIFSATTTNWFIHVLTWIILLSLRAKILSETLRWMPHTHTCRMKSTNKESTRFP